MSSYVTIKDEHDKVDKLFEHWIRRNQPELVVVPALLVVGKEVKVLNSENSTRSTFSQPAKVKSDERYFERAQTKSQNA